MQETKIKESSCGVNGTLKKKKNFLIALDETKAKSSKHGVLKLEVEAVLIVKLKKKYTYRSCEKISLYNKIQF